MKRSFVFLTLIALAFSSFSTAQAGKEVTFGGKIYAHWYTDMSDDIGYVDFDGYNSFGVSRAYLGGTAKLTDKTSGKITIDMNPDNNNVRLKYAYLKWRLFSGQQIGLSAKFGLHETPWNNGMEKIWERRYIAKTSTDELGMLTTSDNGVSLIGDLGEKSKWGWTSLSVFNGTSYSSPWDNNPSKDIALAAFITPIHGNPDFGKSTVGFQYYMGTLNSYNDSSLIKDDYKKTLMSVTANFQYKNTGALGVEYNSYKSSGILGESLDSLGMQVFWRDSSNNIVENKANALTVFGTLWFKELIKDNKMTETLNLFFRYMMFDPDGDDISSEMNSTQLIVGAECVPYKGFRTSLNYRSDTTKDLGVGVDDISNAYLFLNAELAF